MTRTFEVIHNSNSRIVQPYESDSLVYEWEYDNDLSIWRKEIKGSFIFGNETGDYDYFLNIDNTDSCNNIILNIYSDCQAEPEFTGKFSTYTAKWDLDKCILDIEVSAYDQYTCLLEKIDEEFNLFTYYTPQYNVKSSVGTIEYMKSVREIYDDCPDCGDQSDITEWYIKINGVYTLVPSNTIILNEWCFNSQNTYGYQCFHEDFSCPAGQFRRITKLYSRELITIPCSNGLPVTPAGGGWVLHIDNCAIDGTATFRRCTGGTVPDQTEYMNGRHLMSSLNQVVIGLGCGLSGIRSIFFNYNPDISDPIYLQTNNGQLNYVTGQTNCVDNLLWFQITDIKDPLASNPANGWTTSLSKMLAQLKFMFNVRWKIDSDNYLVIEHVSYWTQQESPIDLLSGDRLSAQQRLNRFNKSIDDIPKSEEFSFTEGEYLSNAFDFDTQKLEYNKNCARGDAETYVAESLVTNVYDITTYPDKYTDDAIVIVATEIIGTDHVIIYEQGMASGWIRKNGHLSMANLVNRYHKHERPYKEAVWRGVPLSFFSWVATIGQESAIEFVHCCGHPVFDPDNMFITVLGNKLNSYGYVDKASLQLKSDKLSISFRYKLT